MFPDFIYDEINLCKASSAESSGSIMMHCKKCKLRVDAMVDTLYSDNVVTEKVFYCPRCGETIFVYEG